MTASEIARWNWFMAANFSGKWIVTNGYAEVSRSNERIKAVLLYSPETEPYAVLDAICHEDQSVEASVKSYDSEPFSLTGAIHSDETLPEGKVTSIILTDGFTILGIANGARSNEENLA